MSLAISSLQILTEFKKDASSIASFVSVINFHVVEDLYQGHGEVKAEITGKNPTAKD